MVKDLTVVLENEPGALPRLAYGTFGGCKLVLGVDDAETARAVL